MHFDSILNICSRPGLPTPSYVLHWGLLDRNLQILEDVQNRTGAKIILALKGFAAFSAFPRIRRVLHGTTASSMHEARLGQEEFGGELHVYCVAYKPAEFAAMSTVAAHITVNSLSQWERLKPIAASPESTASFGLRINPGYSEVATELYNPCRPGSRFGVTAEQLVEADLDGIEGLHFHTLCEQNSDALARTLDVVEERFGEILTRMKWLNMGGGHHITREDYDVDLLCRCIARMQQDYGVEVFLEPGEAVALNTGFLVASVIDLFTSGDRQVAILDTSAAAHMPDVLEMPYRPQILGSGLPGERAHTYSLGGLTCLAGDVIGAYSFDRPLEVDDRLVFTDMSHYTMVKNTTFNGIELPSIAAYDPETDEVRVVRRFGYEDYRNRLS